MSITGEAGGQPMKVGVGIADVMCGMYAASAILAALHHRHGTGRGQHIDVALVDCTLAAIAVARHLGLKRSEIRAALAR